MIADDAKRLEMLMRDYELSTLDQRSFAVMATTTLGIGLTVISVIGALLTQACRPDRPLFTWLELGSDKNTCTSVSPYVLMAIPTIPVMVLSVLLVQGTLAAARNRYIRMLEAQIRTLTSIEDDAVTPFGFAHLSQGVNSGYHSVSKRQALLANLQWIPAALIATGVGLIAIDLIAQETLQLIAAITYGVMAFALLGGFGLIFINSTPLWTRLINGLPSMLKRTRTGFASRRPSLNRRYVLLPRPTELIQKSPMLGMTFFIASRIYGHGISATYILIFALILELILYQSRYAVNDLRDMKHDSTHTFVRRRGRLENSPSGVQTGLTALSVRLFLIPLLFIALPTSSLQITWAVSVGVVVLSTILYEFAKARAATVPLQDRRVRYIYAVYLMIGSGYGLRVGVGMHLGGAGWIAVVIGTSFGYLLGIVSVCMAWTLEGYAFPTEAEVTKSRPHVAYLTRQLVGPQWANTPDDLDERKRHYILRERPSVRSVVYLAFVLSILAAGSLGVILERELPGVRHERFLLIVMAFVGTVVCAVAALLRVKLAAAIGALAFITLTFTATVMRIKWGVALFPMSVVSAVYFCFRNLSYSSITFDFLGTSLKIHNSAGNAWRSVFGFLFRGDAYTHHFGVTIELDKLARAADLQRRLEFLGE